MIVYGDPSYEADLHAFATELRHHALGTRSFPPGRDRLDPARQLLVRVGQLEQALEDTAPGHPATASVRSATDLAGAAFVSDWDVLSGSRAHANGGPDAIDRLADLLHDVRSAPSLSVRVKVPEGFAFYTLYPEQYCVAASRWCDENATAAAAGVRRVLVAGVRSIGTSLSAVVAAVLTARGFDAVRVTVRPTGHPFDRRTTLPGDVAAHGFTHALVVDEGPGISGSSMAAVAQACEDIGIPPEHIAFLPGHGHEPGHAASATVRQRWTRTKRYVVPLADLRWGGRSLPELLAAATERLLGCRIFGVADFSAGQWRRQIVAGAAGPTPLAFAPFERTKYLATTSLGRSLLWKFAGLNGAAEQDFARLIALADKGWTPAPRALEHGFIAVGWHDAQGLTPQAIPKSITSGTLWDYISAAAGPPLSPDEQRESLRRLSEMLFWNTKESLGDVAADRTRRWADRMDTRPRSLAVPRYGDGRLAPHEWLVSWPRWLIKTDPVGHDRDHTIVGPQPLAWDVAGALVEWQLDSLPFPETAPIDPAELPFYRAAYAAFRLGMCSLCASMLAPDAPDHARLLHAADRYRADLRRTFAHAP
jgi:hypothetical protein